MCACVLQCAGCQCVRPDPCSSPYRMMDVCAHTLKRKRLFAARHGEIPIGGSTYVRGRARIHQKKCMDAEYIENLLFVRMLVQTVRLVHWLRLSFYILLCVAEYARRINIATYKIYKFIRLMRKRQARTISFECRKLNVVF